MNICALAQDWRVCIPPGKTEKKGIDVPDPWWLLTINTLSLACALVANIALLLRMTRRLSFTIANTLTIFGWSISSLLLIVLVAVVPARLQLPPQNFSLSQAFYYAIIAAVLYFIVSALILVTIYASYTGHHGQEFKLTVKQRTLMLQTVGFLGHLLVGAAVYSYIEGWRFLDAVYWADFTLLTVGIGNYSPATHLGRSLLIPYATSGIIGLGLLVSSIRATLLERGEKRISARMLENERVKMIKRLNPTDDQMGLDFVAGDREEGRSRKEFGLMREVQKIASRKRRWTFLLTACTAWLSLWLIGAVVFWEVERNQHWSYFESLYFAYVSIMTIGYGSLYPKSNSGKSFYVVWTLLAIPTLTILISSLESTIAIVVRDATLMIGELTILPGDVSFKERLRGIFRKHFKRKDHAEENSVEDVWTLRGRSADTTNTGGDEPDLNISQRHKTTNESLNQNRRAFLLAKEIRKVMKHIHESPPRRYTYDEWVWFLELLGEKQWSAAEFHRNAPVKAESESRGTHSRDEYNNRGTKRRSWLGSRSVLMADEAEAERVLKSLCATLEKLLKTNADKQQGSGSSAEESLRR